MVDDGSRTILLIFADVTSFFEVQQNSGNGSFADFLAAISVNFVDSLALAKIGAQFWQYLINRVGPNQTQSDPIGPG
jgi:hypothetical protein